MDSDQQLDHFEFGQMLACVILNQEKPQRLSVEQLVWTVTGDWKVRIACGILLMMKLRSEVVVGHLGNRSIESAEHILSAPVVMVGAPLNRMNEQLKQGVIEGLYLEAA